MAEQPTAPTPIVVNPSPLAAQAMSAVRIIVMVLTALAAVAGFARTRDLAGFIVYMQSQEFLTVLAVIIGVGTFAWSQINKRRQHAEMVTVAQAAPDSVAIVQTLPPGPAPKRKGASR